MVRSEGGAQLVRVELIGAAMLAELACIGRDHRGF